MKIHISHPELVRPLSDALNGIDCVAAPTADGVVEVFAPWLAADDDVTQAAIEILFFVRAWGLGRPGFDARLA